MRWHTGDPWNQKLLFEEVSNNSRFFIINIYNFEFDTPTFRI